MKYKLLTLTLSLFLFFTFATPVLAQGPDGRVVFGGNLTLKEEETIEGDVVVFGGDVTMPPSSTIEGDMVVFGGNANIDGQIKGDVVMLGGNINLGETAVIEGDIGLTGGNITAAEGARIEGKVTNLGGIFNRDDGFTAPIPPIPPVPEIPAIPSRPEPNFFNWWAREVFDFFQNVGRTIGLLVALAVISWVVATFMPQQMKMVGDTVADATLISFGVGLLTALIVAASFLLVLTICLAFIPALASLLLAITVLFGWIVIGQMIGERLLMASGQPFPNFIFSTVVGVTVLTIVARMPIISWIPCIGFIFGFLGWLLGMIVALTGSGAVILTRFGTRPYYASSYAPSGNPSSPAARPGTGRSWAEEDFADLDIASASEAELKAKIQAALAEADKTDDDGEEETPAQAEPATKEPAEAETAPPEKPKRKKRTTRKKSTDKKTEETPEPEEPTPDTPEDEEPK
jgi:cytoskeletal protein CcmA (bactofilin family)